MAFDRRPSARSLHLVGTTPGEDASGRAQASIVLHAVGGTEDVRMAEAVAAGLRRPEVWQVLVHAGAAPAGALPDDDVRWLDVPPAVAEGERTAALLRAFEVALTDERPDLVVTYGASVEALACALAAAKQNIAIAHVGSGALDASTDAQINRAICQRLADTLLAPDADAAARLAAEGVPDTRIHVVGEAGHPASALGAADVIVAHYVLQAPGRAAAATAAWPGGRFPRNSLHA